MASHAVNVQLIARVAPKAWLAAIPVEGAAIEARASNRLQITARKGLAVDVPFALLTNTRAAHLHVWNSGPVDGQVVVDVQPVNTNCDWVHGPVYVERHRVVAALSACVSSQNQTGTVRLQPGDSDVSIILMAEPIPR